MRTALVWAVVSGAAGWLYLNHNGHFDSAAVFATAPAQDSLSGSFVLCGDSHRTNCVVDGDTFWFEGEKIRIADIDTPELSPPRCEAERLKGEAAKSRLLSLLNAGNFSLAAGFRDEDKYGRKLRTVSRAGNSLGDVLIEEGLARLWDGARQGWCQGQ
ncbi:thermonuclease family protein [Rhizobium mongolense]|uniref:thermonuclease family protein n=1 Tax=Rhizobium mongolense TaxID=57676 RepID=UPI0034A3E8A8